MSGFDDWVEGKTGWEWVLGDPQLSLDAARAFYQPWVFEYLLAREKDEHMRRKVVASGQFVDDVSGQLHTRTI